MATAATIDPMVSQPYRVRSVAQETHDTFTLTLEPQKRGRAERFEPGQFSMLWVFGVGELPISISGDPGRDDRLIYTVRSVGQATNTLVSQRAGDCIGVRGPFGIGWPMEAAKGKDVIVVAGGIGLAPLRPVIYEVLANRKDYGRLVILYGARSPKELLYRKELAAWSRYRDTQVLTTVDYGGLSWRGHVGVVTTLFKYARLYPAGSIAVTCGPEIMMRFGCEALLDAGVAESSIYLSMERSMKCAIGLCGHCQLGPVFVCKDGPVFRRDQLGHLLTAKEV